MAWTYLTSITPYNVGEKTEEQLKRREKQNEAFDEYVKEWLVEQNRLLHSISILKNKIDPRTNAPCKKYRIFKNLEGEDNLIHVDDDVFYKSKFLSSHRFKKELINYYKPMNLYVNGPINVTTKNGLHTSKWFVDLFWNN